MTELRWSLLIFGVAFFAGLTLWELRRPRQGREPQVPPERTFAREPQVPPEPTRAGEPPLELPEIHARESLTGASLRVVELLEDIESFPVLEPATPAADAAAARVTEELGGGEDDGLPPLALAEVVVEYETGVHPGAAPAAEAPEASAGSPVPGPLNMRPEPTEPPELPAALAPLVDWPPDQERRIVALRLVAQQPERFAGRSLRQALAAEGFVLGRFAIFHKADEAQRAILSAASLTRPGTFDPQTMDSQHFGGLSLFAVLPGPLSPPQVFEELVTTARNLNDRLCGVLQDEGGTPLTPARIASLREHLASETLL
ncbi:MAG TPA: cell division protein ZipA C-terminal FtsZ-binding domain-containing protein [Steroidobacteraceae bacterium]